MLNPKSKMISIRLSDVEYEGLRNLCVSQGARSVSDLAREAMSRLIEGKPTVPVAALEARVRELQERLEQVEARIDGGK